MFHRRKPRGEDRWEHERDLRCSFCNQQASDTRKLIAGPTAFICSECVDVCVQIIRDDEQFTGRPPEAELEFHPPDVQWPAGTIGVPCSLCGMQVPVDEAIVIERRGALCAGCVDAVEATLAACRRDGGPRGSTPP